MLLAMKLQTSKIMTKILNTTSATLIAFIALSLFSGSVSAFKIEDVTFDTNFGAFTRIYDNTPTSPIQRRHEFAGAFFQQEISYSWNDGKDSWVFTPFLAGKRFQDPLRTSNDGYVSPFLPLPKLRFIEPRTTHNAYGDIREFLFTHISDNNAWELRYGIGKVFWGVTESQHLVDVINQADLRQGYDGEEKLGQSMINFTFTTESGNYEFFALPGFREKGFEDNVGRLNFALANPILGNNEIFMISEDDTTWESNAEHLHTDFAFRWSNAIGASDIGLTYFQGTNRDPVLYNPINEQLFSNATQGRPATTASNTFIGLNFITPHYEQMTQFGIDYQATLGGWLLKLEAIHRDSDSLKTPLKDIQDGKTSDFTTAYSAATTGFEYTFYGAFNSPGDIGLIAEYQWDSREYEATTPYQNDIFLGLRYRMNSGYDRTSLIGVSQDLDLGSYIGYFESSRRIFTSSRISFEVLIAHASSDANDEIKGLGFDATTILDNEDQLTLTWETFF